MVIRSELKQQTTAAVATEGIVSSNILTAGGTGLALGNIAFQKGAGCTNRQGAETKGMEGGVVQRGLGVYKMLVPEVSWIRSFASLGSLPLTTVSHNKSRRRQC